MKKTMRKILAAVGAAAMMMGVMGTTAMADEPIVIRFANDFSDLDQINVEFKAAAERVAERTDGAVEIQIYSGAVLGSAADVMEAILSDAPVTYMASLASWTDYYKDGAVTQAGWLFNDSEEVIRFYKSDIFKKMVEELDKVNIHCLQSGFVGGMRHVVAKRQIMDLEDIKNLKIRVPAFSSSIDMFETIGAVPVAMSSAEQLTALSSGNIDALDQSISLMYSTKSYEIAKEVTMTGQMPVSDTMFCSANFWYGIDEEYRTIIEEELQVAADNYTKYCLDNEAAMREELEAAGVTFHEIDREPFIEATRQDILDYEIGQEVLDAVEQIRADIAAGK